MPDAASYFGITPPGAPLSQFFPQGDDDFRAQLEERPRNPAPAQSGVFGPREYQIASMTGDPQGTLAMAQKIREDMQSQKIIKGLQGLDFGGKDFSPSVAKLLAANPLGAQHSAVQNLLKLKEFSGQQAKDKNYSTQAAQAVKDFYSIRPDDEDYPKKIQDWVQNVDPEVMQIPHVASLFQRGLDHSDTVRSKKKTTEEQNQKFGLQLATAGIHPKEFSQYQDEQGNFDPYLVAYAANKQKHGDPSDWRSAIEPKFVNRAGAAIQNLAKYASQIGSEQGNDKQTALQQNIANRNAIHAQVRALKGYGLSDEHIAEELASAGLETPEAWLGGTPPAMYDPTLPEKDAVIAKENLLDASGKPDYHAAYYRAQGLPVPKAQAAPAPPVLAAPPVVTAPTIPTFNTAEEAEASDVPVGTVVVINGKKFKKT